MRPADLREVSCGDIGGKRFLPGACADERAMKPYYEHAGITIYHGDCREILPQLEYASIFADPPYGVGIKYSETQLDTIEKFQSNVHFLIDQNKPLAITMPVPHLWLIDKPQWVAVWHKPLTLGFWGTPLIPHWEPIVFWNLHKSTVNSVMPDVVRANPERDTEHPARKPVALMRYILRLLPMPVCDPFLGTGTTLVVAKDYGYKAIGIEIEEKYCEIAAKRLAQEVLVFDDA
jgi:site-specific DNA-methyltransferase (adenine-specific)